MRLYNRIAIVGATGLVGQTLLKILESQHFPAEYLILLASERSAGKTHLYLDQSLIIQNLTQFDFSQVQYAFFAAGSEVAKHYAPIAVKAGCVVIDKSSCFRCDPAVPLVVPEINADLIHTNISKIFSVPNCSTIPLVMALKPIQDLAGIERVEVATYQAVSGAGKKGVEALSEEIAGVSTPPLRIPIAFNVIPQIDELLPSGFTKEEMKMQEETRKILHADFIVNVTAVRVPVWQGHSEAVHVKTKNPISLKKVAQGFKALNGVKYVEDEIPTPLTHATNNPWVWIGRLRRQPNDSEHYLSFWLTCDNLYKGAAWNALQIAAILGLPLTL